MILEESPEVQWFDAHSSCRVCGKKSDGILRGLRNQSYGEHCRKCAERRIKAAKKVREILKERELLTGQEK